MRQHIVPILIITAVALGTAACSEDQDRQPTAPDFHTGIAVGSACDFTHLRQLANSYFSTPVQQQVKDTIDAMATAFAADDYSATVKGYGFGVLRYIDAVLNATTPTAGDPNVGSDLVNHLIVCMYDPTAEAASYPALFPESFVIPLTPTLKGAFSVRPPGASDVVKSRPTTSPFSAISVSSTNPTWAATLAGNSPARVLFYGRPGSTTSTFDWNTLPHNATFAPYIVVAVCLNANTNNQALLNEEHVGLLPFEDADFLVPPDCSPTSAMLLQDPMMFARRVVQQGLSMFSPEPLMATAFNPGGVGGRTSGIGSEIGPSQIDSVTVKFQQQPTSTKAGLSITPAVMVLATAYPSTQTVPNVKALVTAVNNNGSTVTLTGTVQEGSKTVSQTTNGSGIATYTDLKLSKNGTYQLVLTGQVLGRPGIKVVGDVSTKFTIAPSR